MDDTGPGSEWRPMKVHKQKFGVAYGQEATCGRHTDGVVAWLVFSEQARHAERIWGLTFGWTKLVTAVV
jgi:hypothetical protein